MRDGRYLIGQGTAAAIYTHWRWPAKARVTLNSDGTALVEAGSHDLGTGTYTVMQQIAADALGLPLARVTVRLGDTRLPASHASIGSATMANAGASVMLAAKAARDKAIELALSGRDAPFAAAAADDVVVADGTLAIAGKNLNVGYAELLQRNRLPTVAVDAEYDPVPEADGPKAVFSFAAVFAEVRVDPDLGIVRLNRFVGAYDAGRIINPKTARSQAIGGIIWGVGQALLEQSETDPTIGRFLNRNYSGYLVPTNADIPELAVLFAGEFDGEASPLGAKGLGELTAVSVAPAIANAVYHATGKRVRDLPITIEKCCEAGPTTNSGDPMDGAAFAGHSLRRGGISSGVAQGVHLARLKQFSGHTSPKTLEEYVERDALRRHHPLADVL
jgi:xanthine dehydrogenase YagR molybdenum-binding subunit